MDKNFGLNFHFMYAYNIPTFFFEFPFMQEVIFRPSYFIKFAQNDKFSNKIDLFAACRDFENKIAVIAISINEA